MKTILLALIAACAAYSADTEISLTDSTLEIIYTPAQSATYLSANPPKDIIKLVYAVNDSGKIYLRSKINGYEWSTTETRRRFYGEAK